MSFVALLAFRRNLEDQPSNALVGREVGKRVASSVQLCGGGGLRTGAQSPKRNCWGRAFPPPYLVGNIFAAATQKGRSWTIMCLQLKSPNPGVYEK